MQTLSKTPAEAEGVRCRAPRVRSTLRSKARVSGVRLFRDSHRRRRGGRGKHRQRVKLCVGTGGSTQLFKQHLWFAWKSLSAVVRHPCPKHSLWWHLGGQLRGRGTLAPSAVVRAGSPAAGARSCAGVTPRSLSSVWKQDLCVSFIMQKNSPRLQTVADVHEAVWTL